MARQLRNATIDELEKELQRRLRHIEVLLERRRELTARLEETNREIAAATGDGAPAATTARGSKATGNGRRRGRRKRSGRKASLGNVLVGVMSSTEPRKVGDLAERVLKAGYRTKAANFPSIVSQTLQKDERFRQARRGYYVLAGG